MPQLLGRRVAAWCAVLVMAVALVAMIAGCGGSALADARGDGGGASVASHAQGSLTGRPAPTSTPSPAPSTPRVLRYAEWRASEPRTIASEEEIEAALVAAAVPPQDAAHLARIAVSCEAPVKQRDGVSIGADLHAIGDQGRAIGAFQIRVDAHPWALDLDLTSLTDSAAAAARVYAMQGLSAWSCK